MVAECQIYYIGGSRGDHTGYCIYPGVTHDSGLNQDGISRSGEK